MIEGLFHYDVMGGTVGTKWRKYMKTMHVLYMKA